MAAPKNSPAPTPGNLHYIRPAGLLLTTRQLDETVLPSPLKIKITQRHEALFDDNSLWPMARVITEITLSLNLMLRDTAGTFPAAPPQKMLLDSTGAVQFEIEGDVQDGEAPAAADGLDSDLDALQPLRIVGETVHGSEVQEFERLHLFDLLRQNPTAVLKNHTILDLDKALAAPGHPATAILNSVDKLVGDFRTATRAILEAQESPVAPNGGGEGSGDLPEQDKAVSTVPAGMLPSRPLVTPERVEQLRQVRQAAMTKLNNFFALNGTLVTELSVAELNSQADIYKVVDNVVEANTGSKLGAWLDAQAEAMIAGAITSF